MNNKKSVRFFTFFAKVRQKFDRIFVFLIAFSISNVIFYFIIVEKL